MDKKKVVTHIIAFLEARFGESSWQGRGKPLDSLILTILSQSTSDHNRDMAYNSLENNFQNWEEVMNANSTVIADSIRSAGLANQKSVRIKNILNWINKTYGSLNIDFIFEQDPNDVIKTFTKLKGIGLKTISVVLMFTCGIDIFPVDTHVHRICRRIGLVPNKANAEKTHYIMQTLIPVGKSYSLHMNFLKLGRTICKAQNPKCDECPVLELCEYGLSK